MPWVDIRKTGEPIPESVQRALRGEYTMQPGQTKPAAEMTDEEISAHDQPIITAILAEYKKAKNLDDLDDDKAEELSRRYFRTPKTLTLSISLKGLDTVCKNYDVSLAVKRWGKEWLYWDWLDRYEGEGAADLHPLIYDD